MLSQSTYTLVMKSKLIYNCATFSKDLTQTGQELWTLMSWPHCITKMVLWLAKSRYKNYMDRSGSILQLMSLRKW